MLHFDWDIAKAGRNLQKHQVDFSEACTVFDDAQYITFVDEEHSKDEERYITIGLSNKARLLLVAHTWRGDMIRIISARKVTKNEEKFYQEAG
jgi:uncharacterized DUF497 family protein